MRSADPAREALPIPNREGKEALSDARRSPRLGSPKGKRNGNYRHGFYTAEALAERRAIRAFIRKFAG
jgi:hypothetical protein